MYDNSNNKQNAFDITVFAQRLISLREMRYKEYLAHYEEKGHMSQQYYFCKTQESFAGALGLDRRAVSCWELGKNTPSLGNLVAICNSLHCTLDYLLGKENELGDSPTITAHKITGLKPDVIEYIRNNPRYRRFLNHILAPERGEFIFETVENIGHMHSASNSYAENYTVNESIKSPLKEIVIQTYKQFYLESLQRRYSGEEFLCFKLLGHLSAIYSNDYKSIKRMMRKCIPNTLIELSKGDEFYPRGSRRYRMTPEAEVKGMVNAIVMTTYEHYMKVLSKEYQIDDLADYFASVVRDYFS